MGFCCCHCCVVLRAVGCGLGCLVLEVHVGAAVAERARVAVGRDCVHGGAEPEERGEGDQRELRLCGAWRAVWDIWEAERAHIMVCSACRASSSVRCSSAKVEGGILVKIQQI